MYASIFSAPVSSLACVFLSAVLVAPPARLDYGRIRRTDTRTTGLVCPAYRASGFCALQAEGKYLGSCPGLSVPSCFISLKGQSRIDVQEVVLLWTRMSLVFHQHLGVLPHKCRNICFCRKKQKQNGAARLGCELCSHFRLHSVCLDRMLCAAIQPNFVGRCSETRVG